MTALAGQYGSSGFGPSMVAEKPEPAYNVANQLTPEAPALNEPRSAQDEAHLQVRLAQIGVTMEQLYEVVLYGYRESKMCTAYDPLGLPALIHQGRSTGKLRDLLKGSFAPHREGFHETTRRADGQIAIVVCRGNAFTGIQERGKWPSTRSPKGIMTELAVLANTGQATVEIRFDGSRQPAVDPLKTWILLYCPDGSEIRVELSLPIGFRRNRRHPRRDAVVGFIDVWGERLVLPPIALAEPYEVPADRDQPDNYEAGVTWKDE